MSKWFKTNKHLPNSISSDGTIFRVASCPFCDGVDTVSCATFHFGKGFGIGRINGLHKADIVKIFPDGKIYRLWDSTSLHNCLFVTNACNFHCLMCPQPPCADNEAQHVENLRILELLNCKVEMVGITGGEPTLFPDRLIAYFAMINRKFPAARVEILTNGSILSDFGITKRLAIEAPLNTCYCVSIHGDTPSLAESIMCRSGGWDKAVQGIENLAKLQQQIEIRIVLTKNNVPYIEDMAWFVYRNFPFVSHIAFMGQEITGEAVRNYEKIWIEPIDYIKCLDRAVRLLATVGMNVSIYNIPLCLLPESSRRFAARSISDWKQGYISQCNGCALAADCCGFFTTSGSHIPQGIKSITKRSNE